MIGYGLVALLSFTLYNIVQHSPYEMSEMQQSILMLVSLIGAAKTLEAMFGPVKPKKRRRPPETYYYLTPEEPEKPSWGTPSQGNPDAGKPEHNHYGM